jgi:DNA-binding response OmpR family regulator
MSLESKNGDNRIVIVDDSRTTRTLLKDLLVSNGFTVSEASNEIGFFNVLFEYGKIADLVIMDLNLVDASGYELVCKMKGIEGYKNIPVIIVTSSKYRNDITMGKILAVEDYIIKPYKEVDLINRINKVLKVQ